MPGGSFEGTETATQIHGPALPGANAPAIFSVPLGNFKSGTLALTETQGADLLAGLWYVNVHTTAFPDGEVRGQIGQAFLAAAVLPSSRSVRVGVPATAFATIVNTGPSKATGCGIGLASAIPAALTYQTTNPETNTVTGTVNTPVDIAAREAQSFVFAITPTAAIPPTEVQLRFDCANSPPAPTIAGVNTLFLSASTTPTADVVAIALLSGSFTPGVLVVDRERHQGAFAVTAVNVGTSDSITVSADTGTATLPLAITLCQTNIATAGCVNPPAPSVTIPMSAGTGAGLAVFVTATGQVPLNPFVNRIFVRFKDGNGVTRGSTSVAVQADPAPSRVLRAVLDGAQQVPPTRSAASGFAFFTYDDVTRQLTFNLDHSNLQGVETAAQIRGPALPGANAPIIFTLPLGNSTSGTLTLTAAQSADLLAASGTSTLTPRHFLTADPGPDRSGPPDLCRAAEQSLGPGRRASRRVRHHRQRGAQQGDRLRHRVGERDSRDAHLPDHGPGDQHGDGHRQ